MTPAEILRKLVAISTPSRVSNLPLLHWVREFLEALGWHVEFLSYLDESAVEKANLIARPPSHVPNSSIDLAFVCHTDTVPYAEDWASALVLTERDGMLHGCGSCDVKGALACFLAAVAAVHSDGLLPGIALILTADEEIGCKGMEQLLAKQKLKIGSAIISEPTSLRPGVAGKGYGLARIVIAGREAHSAFPEQGISAISIAARLIAQIEQALGEGRPDAAMDPLFSPPRTTVNIGIIEGGTAKNIIPGRCSFLVEWRPVPQEPPSEVLKVLEALTAQAQASSPRAKLWIEKPRLDPGFSPKPDGNLAGRLQELIGNQPTGISFGSEASRVARIADEVIVIGPGDMRTAHSERECVPVAELEAWTRVLAQLLATGC